VTAQVWARHLGPGVTLTAADLVAGGSLPAVWAGHWAAEPARRVVHVDGTWCTAGALEERTRAAAGRLAAAGLGPGERVVWSTATSLDAIVACIGALRLGAVVVPVNAAYTARELAHVVGDVRPAVAIVDRPEQATWVAAASGSVGTVVVFPDLSPAGVAGRVAPADHQMGLGQTAAGTTADPVLDRSGPDDAAMIVFTSGTTGAPKGAVLTHANLLAGVRAVASAWRWSPDDRLVLALPLFHVHGLCAGLFGTLATGASAVVLDGFSADGVLDAAERHGGTLFFGVPTMYRRLAESGRVSELARLRLCVSGSAPLPAPLWERVRADAGVAILERYGMTETLLTVSNPYDGERRPGTVGFALPGVEVRTDDADGGLLVRGPSVFGGYWERPAATDAAFDGGWFRTGDVVTEDADGYLAVRGRQTDLIISGGYNVYPAEVEDVLLGHPAVAEVAVVGVPSEEWGETVVDWVVPATASVPVAALAEFAAARLAPYKRPRQVHVVDALPRNAMGKVQRAELRRP
jgi:malonyl-CoA/methylmalonyl-CoA synthetase